MGVQETIFVDEQVIDLVPPFMPHYGHWLAEGIPR